MKKVVWIVVLAALAAGGWWWFTKSGTNGAQKVQFRTAKVERGEVLEGVAASGTVQPVVLVQVGTQVSGVIDRLFADFNSKVTAGQTIALLDSRRLAAQVAQDDAAIARAKADLKRIDALIAQAKADIGRVEAQALQSKADVDRVHALLTQAQQDLDRQRQLAEKRLISPADLDAAVAAKGSLEAQLTSAEASVRQSEAQVEVAQAAVQQNEAQLAVGQASVKQSEAQLASDKVNLDYATITSPVDGVVVSRNVDVGQTVAASLSAPTLFTIAQDLTKVQVQTSVPEADVGKIHKDQKARFGVDAYPERAFDGAVSQVRLASTTIQNVVTYTVIVDATNEKGLLFPGMTANVTFEVARSAKDALKVPATALRLNPPADIVDGPPEAAADAPPDRPKEPAPPTDGAGRDGAPGGGRPAGGEAGAGRKGRRSRGALVYVDAGNGRLRAIPVKAGISDGAFTVVEPNDATALAEGAEVVTSVLRDEEPATTNPFSPQPMRPGGGRGGGR